MNSSDIEFTPPKPNPYANAGRRGLEKLKSNAEADRIQSKKASKNLQLTTGTPEKQYKLSLWYNRFKAFQEAVLLKDLASTPTGKDLERFLDTIVRHITPGGLVPTKLWMELGLGHLKMALTFNYPEFRLSSHDDLRLQCTIDTLWMDGRLTTESKERQWVGVALVKKMVIASLKNAIDNGTRSWDYTANDILMILLTSSLQCRAGDIMRSWFDKQPFPYIIYSDIIMKFVGGFQIENLVGQVTIRNEKGHKYEPSNNRIVMLNALKSSQNNALCTVKWILINALRTDNVEATSIANLLARAKAYNSATIKWKHGDLPLLYDRNELTKSNRATPYEKSALISVLRNVLDKAAGLAGITSKLTTQALRRGGAQDVYMLKNQVKTSNLELVGVSLGHTQASTISGVTNRYIKGPGVDFWSARVDEQQEDPFGPEIKESSFIAPRATNEDLTQVCLEQGMDPEVLSSRRKAHRLFRKRARADWEAQVEGAQVEGAQVEGAQVGGVPDPSGEPTSKRRQLPVSDKGSNVHDFLQDCGSSAEVPADFEEAAFQSMMGDAGATQAHIWLQEPIIFIDLLSKINIVMNDRAGGYKPDRRAAFLEKHNGPNKDPASIFEFACRNAGLGCDYATGSGGNLAKHQKKCPFGCYNENSSDDEI